MADLLRSLGQRWCRGLLVGLAALFLAAPALAREYSTDIDVNDEDDLRELYYDVQIDEEEFRILLLLLKNPIDVNRSEKSDLYALPGVSVQLADAIVEERNLNGPYILLADLMTRVEEITWRLLDRIEPFVYLSMPNGTKPAIRGTIYYGLYKELDACTPLEDDYEARSKYRCQLGYDKWPAMLLSANAEILGWLDLGFAGAMHEGVKKAVYDPASRDIYASYGAPLFEPHSAYLRVRRPNGEAVGGSYHVDYGRGLVISTSGNRDRHGFSVRKLPTLDSDSTVDPHDGLFGGGGRVHSLAVGRADFDLSVFGSVRSYDLYSSYMKLTEGASDPNLITENYYSPRIWVDGQRSRSLTLPDVFRVALAGGNATVRFNRRTHIGVTGYGAYQDRTALEGVNDSDVFLVSQRWPTDVGFGTLGLDGAIGFGLIDFAGEAAFWLAKTPAMALYFRARLEPSWGEFTLSARHYGPDYANPFAHGEANSDQLLGFTDRNEQGLRFTGLYKPNKRFQTRGRVDLGRNILLNIWDLRIDTAITGRPLPWLQIRGTLRFTDQNIALGGRQAVYSGDLEEAFFLEGGLIDDIQRLLADPRLDGIDGIEGIEDYFDELEERAGQKVTLGWQARVDHKKRGDITLRYSRSWTDNRKTVAFSDVSCQYAMQQSHSVRLSASLKPHKQTTIRGSVRYHDADTQGSRGGGVSGSYGDTALLGYVQVEQKIADKLKFTVRGMAGRRLPDSPSACDEGGADRFLPNNDFIYEPTDHELRAFGEVKFSVWVKF